jgi:dethiobiotin synthetase
VSYFITGTDTDVGKTVVATVIAHGLGAHYWKPIQTGAAHGTDSDFARRWLGDTRVLPERYVFAAPLSPHLAAVREQRNIDVRDCEQMFARAPTRLVVEGAGGVLVPINGDMLLADVMARLALPVIVVARTSLGTINHTLLTIEALQRRDIVVRGVIMNGDPQPDVVRTISGYAPVIGEVRWCARFDARWFDTTFASLELS